MSSDSNVHTFLFQRLWRNVNSPTWWWPLAEDAAIHEVGEVPIVRVLQLPTAPEDPILSGPDVQLRNRVWVHCNIACSAWVDTQLRNAGSLGAGSHGHRIPSVFLHQSTQNMMQLNSFGNIWIEKCTFNNKVKHLCKQQTCLLPDSLSRNWPVMLSTHVCTVGYRKLTNFSPGYHHN